MAVRLSSEESNVRHPPISNVQLTNRFSDKHSQFTTTFPIYTMERKTTKVPIPAPQSPVGDGDPDELNEDLDWGAQTPREEEFETVTEEQWVRVNDQAPIWMR